MGSGSISVQPAGYGGSLIARCCEREQIMRQARRAARLLPPGILVDGMAIGPDEVVIAAHAPCGGARCPAAAAFPDGFTAAMSGASRISPLMGAGSG